MWSNETIKTKITHLLDILGNYFQFWPEFTDYNEIQDLWAHTFEI